MSNSNSVFGFSGSGSSRNQFPTQTVATTTATPLTISTDSGTANYFLVLPTGGSIFGAQQKLDVNANSSITGRSGQLWGLPSGESNDQFSSASWDGHPFKLKIAGIGNAGANGAQTIQVNLYQGTSATLGSDNLIGSTGTGLAAVAGGAFSFVVEANCIWDATSEILAGYYTGIVTFAATSQIVAPTKFTSVTSVTAANLSFVGGLTLGNGASSTITLREFCLDKW
jgi:hypothetical protein